MATCKDCIHERVCFALIEKGLPYADGEYPAEAFCMAFRNKADVMEVVRCKDCCWCMVTSQPYAAAYCIKGTRSFIVEADDFCSRGERKEG